MIEQDGDEMAARKTFTDHRWTGWVRRAMARTLPRLLIALSFLGLGGHAVANNKIPEKPAQDPAIDRVEEIRARLLQNNRTVDLEDDAARAARGERIAQQWSNWNNYWRNW